MSMRLSTTALLASSFALVTPAVAAELKAVTCDAAWGLRAAECGAELNRPPPMDQVPLGQVPGPQPFTHHSRCLLFPSFRPLIAACGEAADCEAFAACANALPPLELETDPELCHAFVMRRGLMKQSEIMPRVRELPWPGPRLSMHERLQRLGPLCETDAEIRAGIVGCMGLMDEFSDCVWDLASSLPELEQDWEW